MIDHLVKQLEKDAKLLQSENPKDLPEAMKLIKKYDLLIEQYQLIAFNYCNQSQRKPTGW